MIRKALLLLSASLLAVLVAACGGEGGSEKSTGTSQEKAQRTPLAEANHRCGGHGELGDDDMTLTLQTAGEDSPGGISTYELECYLDMMDVPDSVRSHITQTRALDGRQEASWDSYTAGWTYHPDNGLSLVVSS